MLKNIKSSLFVLYYTVLAALLTPLLGVGVPPLPLRLVFCAIAIIPILSYNIYIYPIVVFCLFTIAKFGVGSPYMPTELFYYTIILFFTLFLIRDINNQFKLSRAVLILTILVLLVDFITDFSVSTYGICLITISLFTKYINKKRIEKFTDYLGFMFIVISVILCLEFLFTDTKYTMLMDTTGERVMWVDPNYLGCVIGMGCLVSLINLINGKSKIFLMTSYVVVIGLCFIVLLLNGSRGALLSVAVSFVYLILMGDTKRINKLVLSFLTIFFIIYLYNNDFFAILEMRMEQESGGGSGRLQIWENKIDAFLSLSNPLQAIFGYGYTGGYALAYENLKTGELIGRAFHNEFLAQLCDYGLVGLVCFIVMFIRPLISTSFHCKSANVCVIYLIINCLTLEPFSLGMFIYFIFLIYAYSQADDFKLSTKM